MDTPDYGNIQLNLKAIRLSDLVTAEHLLRLMLDAAWLQGKIVGFHELDKQLESLKS